MERKLASIQKIVSINLIENYDKVETAQVLGWNCIVKKDDFKPNDLCVYFEPDSVLYPNPIWDSFLAKRKWKIKTIKMCGTISQGLVLPISILEQLVPNAKIKLEEGTDLTEILNVTHFEKGKLSDYNDPKPTKPKSKFVNFMMKFAWFRFIYLFLFGSKPKGQFPTTIISKTDETNIQSIPAILKTNIGRTFYITEKLEGQSATYMLFPKSGFINKLLKRNEFMVCSHNVKLSQENTSSWWYVAHQYGIKQILEAYYKQTGIHLAIQGEIIGTGIQKNIYKIDGYQFFVFNIKNLNENRYLDLYEKKALCFRMGLNMVPIINDNFIIDENITPQTLLSLSNGFSTLADTKREGFVIRALDDDSISFKVRSPEYLLNEKE